MVVWKEYFFKPVALLRFNWKRCQNKGFFQKYLNSTAHADAYRYNKYQQQFEE